MANIPVVRCYINSTDPDLILNILQQNNYSRHSSLSNYIKSKENCEIHVHINESGDLSSVIHCTADRISDFLPKALCSSTKYIIVMKTNAEVDWALLMKLTNHYDTVIYTVEDNDGLQTKLMSVVDNMVKSGVRSPNVSRQKSSSTSNTEVQVIYSLLHSGSRRSEFLLFQDSLSEISDLILRLFG